MRNIDLLAQKFVILPKELQDSLLICMDCLIDKYVQNKEINLEKNNSLELEIIHIWEKEISKNLEKEQEIANLQYAMR